MRFLDSLKRFGLTMLQLTTYSEPIRTLINSAPVDTELFTGDNVDINRFCKIYGEIELGDDVRIGPESKLKGDISIGKGTNVVREAEIFGDVEIGKYCAIARDVTFQGTNHVMHKPGIQMRHYQNLGIRLGEETEPIVIGNDVWIGTQVIVLPGVEIGDGAVIGAGSIVTENVRPYSVVAGVPAEHKKWRFPEEIREELRELQWWNWSEEKKRRNTEFFDTDIHDVDTLSELVQ